MKDLTQAQCDRIAKKLNSRPRKRHGFKILEECTMARNYFCCTSNLILSGDAGEGELVYIRAFAGVFNGDCNDVARGI